MLATLDALGVERAHVVGCSFGAGVAVELALERPVAVASLVLAAPGGSLITERTEELAAFWDLLTPVEAQAWAKAALARGEVEEVQVEGADGRLRRSLARPGTREGALALPEPGERLRLLSPFDPALRALSGALDAGGPSIGIAILHLAILAAAYGVLARLAVRRFV